MQNPYPLFRFFFLALLVPLFSGCSGSIYSSPELTQVKANHKMIAILPFEVTLDYDRLTSMSAEGLKRQEQHEALAMQGVCYTILQKKLNSYSVNLQGTYLTNQLLAKAGLSPADVKEKSKAELARILGVDAVLYGRILRKQVLTERGAFTMGLLTGNFSTAGKEITIDIAVHEREKGQLLWQYNNRMTGGLDRTPYAMTEAVLKEISRKFPYQAEAKN